jgi:hypothetical protein
MVLMVAGLLVVLVVCCLVCLPSYEPRGGGAHSLGVVLIHRVGL